MALANIGWRFYLMWAIFNFSFIPLVYFLYPETKGLHLEQVDHIFEGKSGITQGVHESIHSRPTIGVLDASRTQTTTGTSDEEKAYAETTHRGLGEPNGNKGATTQNDDHATHSRGTVSLLN